MTPARIIWSGVGVLVLVLVVLVARNTEWVDVQMPMPPKGEALTNPMYAAQRFAEALGARATRDQAFAVPGRDAVIVLSDWHWSLVRARRDALKHWVESGGRLVVDSLLVATDQDFEQWSGIRRKFSTTEYQTWRAGGQNCRTFDEAAGEPRTLALFPEDRCEAIDDASAVRVCLSALTLRRPRHWGA